ncbi:toll-like receptor 4 [Liolophura sinensis]|uniref:toll-like receptor 4 n=1 Tax=Liolophura sinensis TaxID=3198878 RepID=UPI00315977C3
MMTLFSMAIVLVSMFPARYTLPGQPCVYISSRNFLDCSFLGLKSVPTADVHFTGAEGLDLKGNLIETIKSDIFSTNLELNYLDLSKNQIAKLEPKAFHGLSKLAVLNLSGNNIELSSDVITAKLFEPLVSLQEIRLQNIVPMKSSQKWRGVDAAFGKLGNLTRLYIDFPRDFVFENGFSALTKLTTISTSGRERSVENCTLGSLRNSTFSALRNLHIKELQLMHCSLVTIESGTFEPLTSLYSLELVNNLNLGLNEAVNSLHCFRNRRMKKIRLTRLNNGTCEAGRHFVLTSKSMFILLNLCVELLDLSENYISYMQLSGGVRLFNCLEYFNMSYHSLRCIPPFILHMSFTSKVLKSFDVSYGFGISKAGGGFVDSSLLRRSKEGVRYDPGILYVPKSLERLDMNAIVYWMFLDTPITFRRADNLRYFGFAYNNLDNCEECMVRGADNLTEMDLSGIRCEKINSEYFLHLRKLKTLSLSNSLRLDLSSSSMTSFDLLNDLEYIDLSGNKISQLHPGLFQNNVRLLNVNLANNKLQRLPSTISHITGLKSWDLSANAFTYLQTDEIRLIEGWITRAGSEDPFLLKLGSNPLQCTCDTILFIHWIVSRKRQLDNPDNYTCLLSNGSQMSVYKFRQNMKNFEISCVSSTYVIISVVVFSTILILILILFGIYRYRLNLRYWLYTKLQPPKDMFLDQDYVFDAFVAYTLEDREFVSLQLRPNLELLDNPLKLCIHDRDFTPGKPIHENIVDKMRESRKILLIISPHFLESTYGPLGNRVCWHEISERRQGRHYIVCTDGGYSSSSHAEGAEKPLAQDHLPEVER